VTRGQLPQRAGSLGLNGGGTAAAVPPDCCELTKDQRATRTVDGGGRKLTTQI